MSEYNEIYVSQPEQIAQSLEENELIQVAEPHPVEGHLSTQSAFDAVKKSLVRRHILL